MSIPFWSDRLCFGLKAGLEILAALDARLDAGQLGQDLIAEIRLVFEPLGEVTLAYC